MSANRTARNEAWITSLVLHVGLFAGIVAVLGQPRGPIAGPVTIDTRADHHQIGIVMLDGPAKRSTPTVSPPVDVKPVVVPVVQPPPPAPVPSTPAGPPAPIRAVGHQEAVPPPPMVHAAGTPKVEIATNVGPPLPAGAATAFFGVPAIGKSVVFVLDRSASMGLDGRLERARHELAASLRQLPPSARFQVIAYNRVAEPLRLTGPYGLVPATPDAVEAAIATIGTMTAEGSSEHLAALTKALALGPDVVYFLTDEDDLEGRDVRTVTRRNSGRTCIHALCLVPPAASETPMHELARTNRGEFRVVK